MRPYPAAATKAAAMHKAVNLKFVNAHTTENNLISPAPKMPERYKKYKKMSKSIEKNLVTVYNYSK